MARYINEDEFVAWVKEHWCADCQNDNGLRCRACWIDDAIDIVEEAPEADVVPKIEYDAVVSAVDNSTKEFLKLHDDYQEAKREVEKLQNELVIWKQNRFNLFQRLECYEMVRQKVAREIFEELDNLKKQYIKGDIDEHKFIVRLFLLKKKYTEGEQ